MVERAVEVRHVVGNVGLNLTPRPTRSRGRTVKSIGVLVIVVRGPTIALLVFQVFSSLTYTGFQGTMATHRETSRRRGIRVRGLRRGGNHLLWGH